jgi:uncharacterized integral membrane protein (TIGR00698 family)
MSPVTSRTSDGETVGADSEKGATSYRPASLDRRPFGAKLAALVYRFVGWLSGRWPGVALAGLVAAVAWFTVEAGQRGLDLGHPVIEPLVLALLLGLALRLIWQPAARWEPGIQFASRGLLEVAIVLLGATMDLRQVADAGVRLGAAVLGTVGIVLLAGEVLGRRAGLSQSQATLVAVGTAICGNSAIAAVATTIRAKRDEVAAAIAVTAVLSVGVVVALPLLFPVLGLDEARYGVLAGLTVYAVPQVLAATMPVSAESGQIGTLVKLTRVLLLGPVMAWFAFRFRVTEERVFRPRTLLPWFVAGFALSALARTAGLVPASFGDDIQLGSKLFTIVAMAALGLMVDVRSLRGTCGRLVLVVLGVMSVSLLVGFTLTLLLGP